MTKPIEVITSVQRRRRWSRAEKERIVAAAIERGAVASEVARAAGIYSSQLFRWRQELCRSVQSAAENAPTFSAVTIAAAPSESTAPAMPALPPPASSVVEIEFASGARMRIAGAVDPSMASAMIAALTTTKRRRRR